MITTLIALVLISGLMLATQSSAISNVTLTKTLEKEQRMALLRQAAREMSRPKVAQVLLSEQEEANDVKVNFHQFGVRLVIFKPYLSDQVEIVLE